jgi:hypothetical protein
MKNLHRNLNGESERDGEARRAAILNGISAGIFLACVGFMFAPRDSALDWALLLFVSILLLSGILMYFKTWDFK